MIMKILDEYVYRCLDKYGNTIIDEKTYEKYGKKTILYDLKINGFVCDLIVYRNVNTYCEQQDKEIQYDYDYIVEVKKRKKV